MRLLSFVVLEKILALYMVYTHIWLFSSDSAVDIEWSKGGYSNSIS